MTGDASTSAIDWESANGQFLAASLAWLRLLLRSRIPGPTPSGAVASSGTAASSDPVSRPVTVARSGVLHRKTTAVVDNPNPPEQVTDGQLAAAADAVDRAEQITPPPALAVLAARLGLSRFERDTLLLCAAVELDPATAALCARAHGNDQMRYPTFGLALAVLPDPAWEIVSPQAGLRFWRLIELGRRTGESLISAPLRPDERIVNYIKGLNYLDDRLSPLVTSLEYGATTPLPPSQRAVAAELEREWRQRDAPSPVVQLAGADYGSKRLLAAYATAASGLTGYRLPAALLPTQPVELEELARLWERECALLPIALYLDVEDIDDVDPNGPPVARFLTKLGGPVALATRETWSDVGRPALVFDVEPPTAAERAQAWRDALTPGTDPGVVDALAAQFAVQTGAIHEIAELTDGDADQAWRECRARTRPRLDALAQRLEPKVGWDDIVLPDDAHRLLRQVADQVAHRTTVYEQWGFGAKISRGLGVSVLFAGPSGTGKTMAAEVLAAQLRLDLYRIDLSAVVSKYIGETEKNLRRLFDAAEGGGSILFFDEADSLFGKRSEVKDSHDRYANIEINYLLQRMEAYRGLAILATNLRGAVDLAFLRRLRFIVEFPFPGFEQRQAIWRKSFPADAPVADLDFDRLAQLPVSGGMARNIAVNAAFLAAAAGSEITMALVLAAARTEFEKLDLPIREREFTPAEVSVR